MLTGGDKAVGLSTDSHTSAVIRYAPVLAGIQDTTGLNDCSGSNESVIQDSATVMPSLS